MDAAVAAAFQPQRIRLGAKWVKNASGGVDAECIPALDLTPDDLARRLRTLCLRQVRAESQLVTNKVSAGIETVGFAVEGLTWHDRKHLAAMLFGDFSKIPAFHPFSPEPLRGPALLPVERELRADEYLTELSDWRLGPREQQVLRLHLEGETQLGIAARLGCCERTVRRAFDAVKSRARRHPPPHAVASLDRKRRPGRAA
jgi:hypothetical protein